MSYQLLIEGRRYQISALLERGISVVAVARTVKCHRSTIYRERRQANQDGHYCPSDAYQRTIQRRKGVSKYRILWQRIELVCLLLQMDWSPEQLANVLTHIGQSVSYEWICRYVAKDKRQGGKLYRHL